MKRIAGVLLGLTLSAVVHAGRQLEEPLADKVRSALAAAVTDGAPPRASFESIDERLAYLRWLGTMSERLKQRKSEHAVRVVLAEIIGGDHGQPVIGTGRVQTVRPRFHG